MILKRFLAQASTAALLLSLAASGAVSHAAPVRHAKARRAVASPARAASPSDNQPVVRPATDPASLISLEEWHRYVRTHIVTVQK